MISKDGKWVTGVFTSASEVGYLKLFDCCGVLTEGDRSTDTDTRVDILFDRLLLIDFAQMITEFDSLQLSSLKQLTQPPQLILHVFKAVVLLVNPELCTSASQLSDWSFCLMVCGLLSVSLNVFGIALILYVS